MSRGPGVVQRHILDYLAAGHPEPDGRGSMFGRYKPVGHPLWKIAAAYTGTKFVDRSTMCSFGRAMAALRRGGLIQVQYRYKQPHLRLTARKATRKGGK